MSRVGFWVVSVGVLVWLVGCDSAAVTAPFWSTAERQEQAQRYVEKAIVALDNGDSDRVDQCLNLAVTLASPEGEGALPVAERLLKEGRISKAALLLQAAVQSGPLAENPLALGTLARLYDLLGDSAGQKQCTERADELAAQALDLVDRVAPGEENARQSRVRQLLRAGQYALEFRDNPKKGVRLLRGAIHLSLGDPVVLPQIDAQALSLLGLALARHPELAEDKDEAVRFTRVAARHDAGDGVLLARYGTVLQSQGDLAGARRVFGELVELQPENTEAHIQLAQVLVTLQLVREAAVELERALVLEPRNPQALALQKRLPNPLPAPEADPEEELV